MKYEDKVNKILKYARDAEYQSDLDELAYLENGLAAAQFYRLTNPRRAHRILDKALGGRWHR